MNSIKNFFILLFTAKKIAWQWLRGSLRLSRITKPIITVFGGRHLVQNSAAGKEAYQLARDLVDKGYFLLTGGGPGAMEAVHCGALEGDISGKNGDSLGIGVHGVDSQFKSSCSRDIFFTDFFCVRKWLLIHYSQAIIVLPGGYGTADELFEVANLVKLQRIKKIPIILIGAAYWQPMKQWIEGAVAHGLIPAQQAHILTIVDDISQVMKVIER